MPNDRLCRWAGWGRGRRRFVLDDRPGLKACLAQQLGPLADTLVEPAALENVAAPPSRLSDSALADLSAQLPADRVCTEPQDRLIHSVGRSYRDMLRAWSGRVEPVTDAVVYPAGESDVAAVIAWANANHVAVIPFGGGTSVVGGIEPRTGRHEAVVTLDTLHLNHVVVDAESHLADVGAGTFGPDIERALGAAGFTLGHFPQSFEYTTLGGWIAPRGGGQQSTRYGKIETMVQAVRMVTPAGLVVTRNVPAAATGPSLLQQVVGSEGTLGVITSATVRIRRLPEETRWLAFLLPDFESGCAFFRRLVQADLPLSVTRLSDAEETRWMARAAETSASLGRRLAKGVINWQMRRRGFDASQPCMALLSLEGAAGTLGRAAARVRRLARGSGAIFIGSSPGKHWLRDRFRLPYLRDDLMARRIMIDTLETATTWSNLPALYAAVSSSIREAMERTGKPGAVLCHLSHLYETGSSLYFTFLAGQIPGSELEQWQAIKQAATEAILAHHGALSHHHGMGYEHRPLSAEHSEPGAAAMARLKDALDPAGIMNPGKLFEP